MLSDEDMYDRMKNGWRMGRPFTECGNGSTPEATANIRRWLPLLVQQYGIHTVNDAGAGDMAWLAPEYITWRTKIKWRPFDLIPRRPDVQQLDITTELMPPADAIFCRMVLNHLDEERIEMALPLFRRSARYLIATQFNGEDLPQRSPQFTRLDLREWLGIPLDYEQDGLEPACSLAIWDLRQ